MQALDLIPEIAAEFATRLRPRLRRPGPQLPQRRRRDDRRRARLGARHDRGRRRRAARRGRQDRRARHQVLPALPARRGARGARPRAARGRAREGARGRHRRHRLGERAHGALGHPAARLHRDRRARRAPDHEGVAAAACSPTRSRTSSSRSTFLDMDWELVERELAQRGERRSGPHAENILRDIGTVAARLALREEERDALPADQVLPSGQLRGRQPAARPGGALGAGAHGPLELAHLRSPRLPGLRRGARRALRARRRDARHRRAADRGQRDRLPRGLLDALPRVVLAAALDPLAVRQRAGGRDRHRRGAEGEGPHGRARGRPGRRRRHGRHRLRLPVGDVRAQRRRAVHLLRQRGLHEHRRAALGRHAARGAHGHHQAGRRRARQRLRPGQERAADRDGARDPLRRHRDGRRAARPRVQGRARDGVPRRALPARLRALPARLGLRLERHDPDRAARQGDRPLPGVRGRARRGRRASRRSAGRCRSRST